MSKYLHTNAIVDQSGKYRYSLNRTWDEALPAIVFIGLNPSIADANVDDPTIRKCVTLSKNLGYGSLYMVNLFAYRATDPKELRKTSDPVGKENDGYLSHIISEVGEAITCWGRHGKLNERDTEVVPLLVATRAKIYDFGFNKNGTPKHPLYLKNDTQLRNYSKG